MFIVYILKSIDFPKSYVGMTNDIDRRIGEHNAGKHPYTKRYVPWELIYKEEYWDRKSARLREKYLKSAVGRKFIKKLF